MAAECLSDARRSSRILATVAALSFYGKATVLSSMLVNCCTLLQTEDDLLLKFGGSRCNTYYLLLPTPDLNIVWGPK